MAALRAAVFPLSAKNRRGGHFFTPPPSSARVNVFLKFSKFLILWSFLSIQKQKDVFEILGVKITKYHKSEIAIL